MSIVILFFPKTNGGPTFFPTIFLEMKLVTRNYPKQLNENVIFTQYYSIIPYFFFLFVVLHYFFNLLLH
jgi:uncharacterized membrane protein (GlpM family)